MWLAIHSNDSDGSEVLCPLSDDPLVMELIAIGYAGNYESGNGAPCKTMQEYKANI